MSNDGQRTITLATGVQLGVIIVIAGFAWWIITFVSTSVDRERTERMAEVNGQAIQRTADMARLRVEVDTLRADLTKHEDREGHSGVLAELQKIKAQMETEMALRQASDESAGTQRDMVFKRLDLERDWNEDQERRYMDVIQRLARLEQAAKDYTLLPNHK